MKFINIRINYKRKINKHMIKLNLNKNLKTEKEIIFNFGKINK